VKTLPDRKYNEDHIWVKIGAENTAIVGITYFAQESMGEMTYVEFPEIGMEVAKGEFLCVIASSKAIVDILSPLSGEVIENNKAVDKKPKLVNESPYEEGWLIKIKASDIEELNDLMSSEAYEEVIENSA
jgi:glycine cleavage system H protein